MPIRNAFASYVRSKIYISSRPFALALASLALASYARAPASRASVPESVLQSQVMTLLRHAGYMTYHVFDSRRTAVGFPDIVALKGRDLLVLELKTDKGKVTPEQYVWLRAFANVGRSYVVRPRNLDELAAIVGEDMAGGARGPTPPAAKIVTDGGEPQ